MVDDDNTYSINRLDSLNQTFTAYFGQHWTWVLMGYAILLSIIILQLYFSNTQINISTKSKGIVPVLLILSTLIILLLGIISFRLYLNQNKQKDDDDTGDFSSLPPYKQIIILYTIISMTIFFLVLFSFWAIRQ